MKSLAHHLLPILALTKHLHSHSHHNFTISPFENQDPSVSVITYDSPTFTSKLNVQKRFESSNNEEAEENPSLSSIS